MIIYRTQVLICRPRLVALCSTYLWNYIITKNNVVKRIRVTEIHIHHSYYWLFYCTCLFTFSRLLFYNYNRPGVMQGIVFIHLRNPYKYFVFFVDDPIAGFITGHEAQQENGAHQ